MSFDRSGKVMMAHTLKSEMTSDWRDLLSAQDSDWWFYCLKTFLNDELVAALDNESSPSSHTLRSLPFHSDQPGAYAGILTPSSSVSALSSYVYPGCATRKVKERTNEHENPQSLIENPNKKYYQLRHGTKDYAHKFVTLARIPNDGTMSQSDRTLRRILCRVAETFFTI
jgi:hypothetical protein